LCFAIFAAFVCCSGCSTATYYVFQKDTYKVGVPLDQQPNATKLQAISADAPGGEAFVGVLYVDATHVQLRGNGDSSALVQATAAVGRLAVDAAKSFAGVK
jgi:hypothetical protein